MFLNTLTKEMFSSVKTDDKNFGGGFAEDTWRGMQAEQFASAMADQGGIGLADQADARPAAEPAGSLAINLQCNRIPLVTAAQRLAALDELPARDLIAFTDGTLGALVEIMNRETTLLRAGRYREAATLTADKTRLAQDYVTYSRAVQRQIERLKAEAPDAMSVRC